MLCMPLDHTPTSSPGQSASASASAVPFTAADGVPSAPLVPAKEELFSYQTRSAT